LDCILTYTTREGSLTTEKYSKYLAISSQRSDSGIRWVLFGFKKAGRTGMRENTIGQWSQVLKINDSESITDGYSLKTKAK
jgi:hypothetical protein